MSEEKKNKCQICGGYLFEDDDVVICPTCGAPHHKDCWQSVGHCGVADDHGTDRQYDKLQKAASEAENEAENTSEEGRKCNFCGRVSKTSGAEFCPYCGQPYNGNGVNHAHPPFVVQDGVIKIDPYGGLPKDSKIEGATVKDIATFTGNNSARYIHKFKDLNKGNKKSWNWLAFLFPSAWCLSRKMYTNGILYLILSVASALCTDSFMLTLESYGYDTTNMSSSAAATFITENFDKIPIIAFVLSLVGLLLFFVPRFICGLYGDWSYRGFALEKIKKIRSNNEIDEPEEALAHAGSVSLVLGIVAIFVENYLPVIILSFL